MVDDNINFFNMIWSIIKYQIYPLNILNIFRVISGFLNDSDNKILIIFLFSIPSPSTGGRTYVGIQENASGSGTGENAVPGVQY